MEWLWSTSCSGHVDAGTALIDRHPDARVIIDHMGTQQPASAPWTLAIHAYVHPGRTRCMRHGLPHARRIGRGMLLLLLPLRAFRHGGTGKFVDRAVAAGTLEKELGGEGPRVFRLAAGAKRIRTAGPTSKSAQPAAPARCRRPTASELH